jgi:transposase-like protein
MAEEDPPLRRKRRRHSPEVKAEAVRRAVQDGEQVTHIAADMDIDHRTVWVWVNAAKNAAINPDGDLPREAIARIRELERENALLRRDLEFAKKLRALNQEMRRESGSR